MPIPEGTAPETPVAPAPTPTAPAVEEKKDRKTFLMEEIGKILAEYGGLESNIPVGQQTNYWTYQNELRGLARKY